MVEIPEQLQEAAEQLKKGRQPKENTVRELLAWFDAERRAKNIVQRIREALAELSIETEPDFESAYIDSSISFIQATAKGNLEKNNDKGLLASPTTVNDTETSSALEAAYIGGAVADPTYRISKLASANKTLVYVSPDSELQEATTLMLRHDFSQLPVMQNERNVKGVVSWYSIGVRLSFGHSSTIVRNYTEQHQEIRSDASLFEAIPSIVENQYVLVRDAQNRISGIVTTSDLSMQFGQLGEPFLLIGEIENHIRRLIDGKFTAEELATHRDPSDAAREVERVADLTFGEYKRLLEQQDYWDKLCLNIDRKMFTNQLDEVRRIRNDVMHFDPDGLPDEDLTVLRQFARFLQKLHKLGAV